MRARNKLAAALSASALIATGLVATTVAPASAVAVNGGCASFFVDAGTPIESTGGASGGYLGSPKGAWSDEATTGVVPDYTLTSSGGSTVGSSRSFALTYDKGMKSFAPASGTQYWYFSVNGVQLPAITNSLSIGTATAPGATINGSYTVSQAGANNIVFEKMIFDATAGVRVVCSGQDGNTAALNSHTTPMATNVSASFSAVGPSATVTGISNQVVTTHARPGDVISFDVSLMANGTGTAALCDAAGNSCHASTSSVTIAGGTGSGTLTVPAGTAGARTLKVTSGSDTALRPVTVLGAATLTANVEGGGAGTVVTLNGTNWDPSAIVSVQGMKGAGQSSTATTDAAITPLASPTGTFTAQYTVNDVDTTQIVALDPTRMTPGATFLIPASVPFAVSGDSCTAKVGAATGGSCFLLETVKLDVTAGDLKMSKESGDVELSPVALDGTAHTSTGSLKDVTVKDYRGGTLGWDLVATFSGLNGPATIAPSKLSWTPSCTTAANNDDTVVAGTAGAFADAATARPLCSVDTGLGTDGVSGGDTTADAALSVDLLANQAAGAYTGTFKITLS